MSNDPYGNLSTGTLNQIAGLLEPTPARPIAPLG